MKCSVSVLWGAVALVGASVGSAPQDTPSPYMPLTSAHADEPVPPQTVTFAPIDYFQNQCSRCHGSYGMNYGEDLKPLSDAKLKGYVLEMSEGPGQSPLDAEPLEKVTAYHRSLLDGRPFLAVTQVVPGEQGLAISGEATPGASVQIVAANSKVMATLTDHTWKAVLPTGTKPDHIQIIASIKDKQTNLDLSQAQYSHIQKLGTIDNAGQNAD